MTANTKSMLLLAMTLVTGFALGLFADASLVRGRRDRIDGMRRPPGFVEHIESVIQPHSTAQRDSIRPVLEAVARNNQQAIRDVNTRLRAALDSMKTALSPMLDESQRDRLAREVEHMPDPFRPGGRGRGGPGRGGRGGPPEGRRGPPPS